MYSRTASVSMGRRSASARGPPLRSPADSGGCRPQGSIAPGQADTWGGVGHAQVIRRRRGPSSSRPQRRAHLAWGVDLERSTPSRNETLPDPPTQADPGSDESSLRFVARRCPRRGSCLHPPGGSSRSRSWRVTRPGREPLPRRRPPRLCGQEAWRSPHGRRSRASPTRRC